MVKNLQFASWQIGELADYLVNERPLRRRYGPCTAVAMHVADELRNRTLRYALRIVAFCRNLPETWEAREIGRQLLRAGMGTAGNYWSACRGRSRREFIAKLDVAVDEAEESVLWLTVTTESGIQENDVARSLLLEGREILAILARSHKTARENRQA